MVWSPNEDKAYWERAYGRPLAEEEVVEIRNNLVKFVKILVDQQRQLDQEAEGGNA